MIGLLRKSSLFYISHLFTFSLIGVVPAFEGKPGAFLAMAGVVPLWMSSSVLWSERGEEYKFLRLLPLTTRDIVSLKLSLILAAGTVYMGVLATYILIAGDQAGRLSVNLVTAAFGCLAGVLLAFLWQMCIWRFGISVMTPVILAAVVLQFFVVFIPLLARTKGRGLIGINEVRLFQLLAQPVWFLVLLATATLVLAGLWLWSVSVYEQSDPS